MFKREFQVFKKVSFEPSLVAVSLSLLVEARGNITFKVKEFINFIISIIMKSFPTAVEKITEKHF